MGGVPTETRSFSEKWLHLVGSSTAMLQKMRSASGGVFATTMLLQSGRLALRSSTSTYERLGYRCVGTAPDFPAGHERYFMIKDLNDERTA